MIKFSKSSVVDVEKYGERLNRLGFVYYDRNAAKDIVSYLGCRAETLAARATFIMKLRSGCGLFCLNKDTVFRYLTFYEHCPEHYFFGKRTQSFSLDINRVLEKLRKNGKAVEFLDYYIEHRSLQTKYNNFKKLVADCSHEISEDHAGNALASIPFVASVQKNQRFNYKQFDILSQFPKEACTTISAPKGYFLAWGDFAQSDFRVAYNLFIRSPENDKIMNAYEDKYEALARIVKGTLNEKFDPDVFKEERKVYKRMTLATIYGTRDSVVKEEQDFIRTFSAFLDKCPRYAEYYKRLKEHLRMHSPIAVSSYFGHTEYIMYNSKDVSSTLFDALNSPIQAGTSALVILVVNSILDKAYECGLSEEQFSVYMTRHDEPIFLIREDALDYLWILKQHSEILVDNWTPLNLDFKFGYHYLEEDAELTTAADHNFKENVGKIDVLDCNAAETINDYYPLKPLLNLCVHWNVVGEKTVMTFYQEATGQAMFSLLETADTTEIIKAMRLKLADAERKIAKEYQGVLVRSNFYVGEDYFGTTHVVYEREIGPGMNKVVQLCNGMTNMYCLQNGLPTLDTCFISKEDMPPLLSTLVV